MLWYQGNAAYSAAQAGFPRFSNGDRPIIPTRCRDLLLKQFCLEDIAPAVLIILITHIIIAVRWMLIKILSAVINGQRHTKRLLYVN